MKTENLDKFLVKLGALVSPFSLEIPKGIKAGIDGGSARDKLAVFVWTREVLMPPNKWVSAAAAERAADFCASVTLYYMLKGAGCEAEIADHRELDVVMEVLR